MLYPVGISSFEKIRTKGFVYVDKTDLIYRLASEGSVYFLSRPRRFGKSLLISTLDAYFRAKRSLFQGLAIEKLEQNWEESVVLHLSFGGTDFGQLGGLESYLNRILKTAENEFGIMPDSDKPDDRLYHLIITAYKKFDRGVVVLIDEYDKPLLDTLGYDNIKDENGFSLEEHNRKILRSFFSVLKDSDAYLRFVMLTGITKFSQVSVFSGLNNLQDISMAKDYEAICGISQDELNSVFYEPINDLAVKNGISYDEEFEQLKKRYDGYHFSESMTDIFNPFSILNVLKEGRLRDYWFATGTPSYLVRLLRGKQISVNDVAGREFTASQFMNYKTDVYEQNVLPLLYQSGYLTIKNFDPETELYTLDFPNTEVRVGFLSLVMEDYFQKEDESAQLCRLLANSLRKNNLPDFFDRLTSFLASVPYTVRRKSTDKEREAYFQLSFYLILRLVTSFTTSVEYHTSQGRIDCLVSTATDVYIFEFKLDGSVDEALRQIEAKGYAQQFASSGLAIHKIGVNFSSESGTVDSWADGE